MSISDQIQKIRSDFRSDLDNLSSENVAVDQIRIKYLGRKGLVASLFVLMGKFDSDASLASHASAASKDGRRISRYNTLLSSVKTFHGLLHTASPVAPSRGSVDMAGGPRSSILPQVGGGGGGSLMIPTAPAVPRKSQNLILNPSSQILTSSQICRFVQTDSKVRNQYDGYSKVTGSGWCQRSNNDVFGLHELSWVPFTGIQNPKFDFKHIIFYS